jgi:disulfide bond formation protein DsbB
MFFCRTKNPDKIVAMASLLILGGVVPLAVAVVSQYGFGLHPCHYCLLQRYPYILVIAAGVASLLLPRGGLAWRFCVALGICGWLATGGLGLIHTGIEAGWLIEKGGCTASAPADASLDALRASIVSAPLVACNDVAARFLGLSMATWNSITAAGLIALAFLQYRVDMRRFRAQ